MRLLRDMDVLLDGIEIEQFWFDLTATYVGGGDSFIPTYTIGYFLPEFNQLQPQPTMMLQHAMHPS